jgi:type IV pilus assembly protein PilB
MSETRLRLGETLVEAGVLTPEALEKALAIQQKQQLRLGTILLHEGFVTESQLVQALSLKLSIPWVSLWRIDIPDEVLELVPSNVAEEFFLMPIYIRTSKTGERALYVAMNDPLDEDALRFVAANAGMPVKPMIAGPSDIAAAIRAYYYGEDEEVGEDDEDGHPVVLAPGAKPKDPSSMPPPPAPHGAPPPPPPARSAPPATKAPEVIPELEADDDGPGEELAPADLETMPPEAPPEMRSEAPPETRSEAPPETRSEAPPEAPEAAAAPTPPPAPQPEAVPEIPAVAAAAPPPPPPSPEAPVVEDKVFVDKTSAQREAEKRLYGVGGAKPTRGFSIALLDGTTISFGPKKKRGKSAPAAAPAALTQDDLLAGLKAAANGDPVDDFLPAAHWESYMAALLKVLLNKHLVFFPELMKELETIEKKK